MAKHSYTVGCPCPRCTREAARREAQSRQNQSPVYLQPVRRGHARVTAQDRRERHLMACWENNVDDTSDWGN